MKKLLILCLALLLCGCAAKSPAAPAPQSDSTAAVQTPAEPEPAPVPDPAPESTPAPVPEPAPEPESPASEASGEAPETEFVPYTVKISDPWTVIYDGAGFVHSGVSSVGEAGVYTIVEEAADADGNPWGRLKSGAGWICLTGTPYVPFCADYAMEHFAYDAAFRAQESAEQLTRIGFQPNETLTKVTFALLTWDGDSLETEQVLYTAESMSPDQPFLAEVVYYGDMTTYGFSFTDSRGAARSYALSVSGMDGSLVVTEYPA